MRIRWLTANGCADHSTEHLGSGHAALLGNRTESECLPARQKKGQLDHLSVERSHVVAWCYRFGNTIGKHW